MINLIHILIYSNAGTGGWENTLLDTSQIPKEVNYKLIIIKFDKLSRALQENLKKNYDIIKVFNNVQNLDETLKAHKCTHLLFTSHPQNKVINPITNKKDNLFYIHHGLVGSKWGRAERLRGWSRDMNYVFAGNQLCQFVSKFTNNIYQIDGLPQIDLLHKINKTLTIKKNSLLITINVPKNRKKEHGKDLERVLSFFETKYTNIFVKEKCRGIKSCESNVKKKFPQVQFINKNDCLYKHFNVEHIFHMHYGSSYPESLIVHNNVTLYEPQYGTSFDKYKGLKVIKSFDDLANINLDQPIPKESIAEFFKDEFGVSNLTEKFTQKFCEYLIKLN